MPKSKESRKILVVLCDRVDKDSFVAQQLGIESFRQLFIQNDFYFLNPSKWFPQLGCRIDFQFSGDAFASSLSQAEIDRYRPLLRDYEVVILWPVSQWVVKTQELLILLQHLIKISGGGTLQIGSEWAHVLTDNSEHSEGQKILKIAAVNLNAESRFMEISVLASPSRCFNNLSMDETSVQKTCESVEKGEGEAEFLKSIPSQLKKYFPDLISTHKSSVNFSYRIPRYAMLDLSRHMIHNSLQANQWSRVFELLKKYFNQVPRLSVSVKDSRTSLSDFLIDKMKNRLSLYSKGIFYKRAMDLAEELEPLLREKIANFQRGELVFSHGDLCFSNILIDRVRLMDDGDIHLVDPRGIVNYRQAFLPLEYDLAKLSHSVRGGYDWILAGNLTCPHREPLSRALRFELDRLIEDLNADKKMILLAEASLFLSMLPLHMDRYSLHGEFLAAAKSAIKEYQEHCDGH